MTVKYINKFREPCTNKGEVRNYCKQVNVKIDPSDLVKFDKAIKIRMKQIESQQGIALNGLTRSEVIRGLIKKFTMDTIKC